ncbi:MAG: hypothetical protein LBL98_03795 [Ruminococcus sp.]|jgi:hypothetical protein|nr:hypothetical protein [Ruminococcus sp.]
MGGENDEAEIIATAFSAVDCTLLDSLDGRCTLDVTIMNELVANVAVNDLMNLYIDEKDDTGTVISTLTYRFIIRQIHRFKGDGGHQATISGEQLTFILNDTAYDLTGIKEEGNTAEAILMLILLHTPIIPGDISDFPGSYTYILDKTASRREVLMDFINMLQGEIEYDGKMVNVKAHRGSETFVKIMDGKTVTSLSVTETAERKFFDVSFYKKTSLHTGDNVHIIYKPLGIDYLTRIVSISYNPFNRRDMSLEVGYYGPEYTAGMKAYETENKVAEITEMTEAKAWDIPIQSQYEDGTEFEAGEKYVVSVTADSEGKKSCTLVKDEGGGGEQFPSLDELLQLSDIYPMYINMLSDDPIMGLCMYVPSAYQIRDPGYILAYASFINLTDVNLNVKEGKSLHDAWLTIDMQLKIYAGDSPNSLQLVGYHKELNKAMHTQSAANPNIPSGPGSLVNTNYASGGMYGDGGGYYFPDGTQVDYLNYHGTPLFSPHKYWYFCMDTSDVQAVVPDDDILDGGWSGISINTNPIANIQIQYISNYNELQLGLYAHRKYISSINVVPQNQRDSGLIPTASTGAVPRVSVTIDAFSTQQYDPSNNSNFNPHHPKAIFTSYLYKRFYQNKPQFIGSDFLNLMISRYNAAKSGS